MAYTWGCLSLVPQAHRWGDYLVLPYAQSDSVIAYMATALPSEELAVLFEFPTESVSVVLPELRKPGFSLQRKTLPGLAPDRCVFVMQLHHREFLEQFMTFADEIVADMTYGPGDSAKQLQTSLNRWCRLFCGGAEHVSDEEVKSDIPF